LVIIKFYRDFSVQKTSKECLCYAAVNSLEYYAAGIAMRTSTIATHFCGNALRQLFRFRFWGKT